MATLQSSVQYSDAQRKRVQDHLKDLLDSAAFAGSPRRQAFLRYVVEETLAGRGEAIKETNIAVDVFERGSDFDTQSASIVRVTGSEVRKRLAQAYASGLEHDVRIDLPVGNYHPFFHFFPAAPPREAQVPKTPPRNWKIWAGVGLTAAIAAAALSGAWTSKTPQDYLWQPFLGEEPVLVSLMDPTLIVVSEPEKVLPLTPDTLVPASQLREMESTFVGIGGALGAALFSEQLALRRQPFVVKFGSDLSFADLKNAPAILVGASRWTRELTQKLRFRMTTGLVIQDSKNPERTWSIAPGKRKDRAEGYSLVTRLVHSESGHPTLMVEGIDARNTQAAVEFLAKPGKFDEFTAGILDWRVKNFQVVLHSTIHGNSPGSLDVAAFQVW
jgi:hypothetical protein